MKSSLSLNIAICAIICVWIRSARGEAPRYEKRIDQQPAEITCIDVNDHNYIINYRIAKSMPHLAAYDGKALVSLVLYDISEIKFMSIKTDTKGRRRANVKSHGEYGEYDIMMMQDNKPIFLEGVGRAGSIKIGLQNCKSLNVRLLEDPGIGN